MIEEINAGTPESTRRARPTVENQYAGHRPGRKHEDVTPDPQHDLTNPRRAPPHADRHKAAVGGTQRMVMHPAYETYLAKRIDGVRERPLWDSESGVSGALKICFGRQRSRPRRSARAYLQPTE